jgi:hypothetical protein
MSGGGLAQFRQDTATALGMNEGNLRMVGTGARCFVNHPQTFILQFSNSGGQVVDGECHVMQTLAAFLNELGNRAFGIGGFEQFQTNIVDFVKRNPHLLAWHFFNTFEFSAQSVTVKRLLVRKGSHGNPNVIERLDGFHNHVPDADGGGDNAIASEFLLSGHSVNAARFVKRMRQSEAASLEPESLGGCPTCLATTARRLVRELVLKSSFDRSSIAVLRQHAPRSPTCPAYRYLTR